MLIVSPRTFIVPTPCQRFFFARARNSEHSVRNIKRTCVYRYHLTQHYNIYLVTDGQKDKHGDSIEPCNLRRGQKSTSVMTLDSYMCVVFLNAKVDWRKGVESIETNRIICRPNLIKSLHPMVGMIATLFLSGLAHFHFFV